MKYKVWLLLTCSFLFASSAIADWLIMKDGSRLETEGEWRVKGAMVVFTLPNGSLASVRADEVDLDASAVATVAAKENAETSEEAPPAEPAEVEPVAVLTNADIGQARQVPSTSPSGDDSPQAEGEAEQAVPQGGLEATPIDVEVVTWRDVDSIAVQGVEIRGTLRNSGDTLARELVLIASLYDDKGELVASAEAFLDQYLLQPSATTNFRVLFPEVATYFGDPGFQIRGRGPLYGKITGISNPREETVDDSTSNELETDGLQLR